MGRLNMIFRMKIIVPIALAASILSTFGVYKYLDSQKKRMENQKSKVQRVVVATQNLQIGYKIQPSNIALSEWPREIVPPGAFGDTSDVLGRVLKTEVFSGEIILNDKLAPIGSEGGFASIIPAGMRALTVSVTTASGVSGFILPNAHVDVLVTVASHTRNQESSTKIILEDVKVLAIDQTYDRTGDDPVLVQTVTLLVRPDQAEKLVLASTEGKLQLSLRNTADRSVQPTKGVKLKELIYRQTPRRLTTRPASNKSNVTVQEKENSETVVEIIRSSERSEVKFVEGKLRSQKDKH